MRTRILAAVVVLCGPSVLPAGPSRGGGGVVASGVAAAPPVAKEVPRPKAPDGPSVTDGEAELYARTLEKAVREGDEEGYAGAIDWDAVLEAATDGIEAPEAVRDEFARTVKASLRREGGLVSQVLAPTREGGSFKLLRILTKDGRKVALFRTIVPKGGVRYDAYALARRPDGKVRAVDVDHFLTGDLLSRSLRNAFVPTAAAATQGLADRLTGPDRDLLRALPTIGVMTDLIRSGKTKEALATYEQLSPALKKEKNVLLLRLRAVQSLGEEDEKEYARAIEDFRKAHPDDPCIDLLAIDVYVVRRKYPEALACVDRLEAAVGGDPYLEVLRAGINIGREKYVDAARQATRAIEQEPSMPDAYWTLLTATLRRKDYPEALKVLKRIDELFGVTVEDMKKLPEYAGFIQSPQYGEWLAYLQEKAKKGGKQANLR